MGCLVQSAAPVCQGVPPSRRRSPLAALATPGLQSQNSRRIPCLCNGRVLLSSAASRWAWKVSGGVGERVWMDAGGSTRTCSRFVSVFRKSSWMYGLSASSTACTGVAGWSVTRTAAVRATNEFVRPRTSRLVVTTATLAGFGRVQNIFIVVYMVCIRLYYVVTLRVSKKQVVEVETPQGDEGTQQADVDDEA